VKNTGTSMRYSRALPPDFEQLLLPGGSLRFIVDLVIQSGPCATDKALDLQLREYGRTGRKVTLYRGGTAILHMRLNRRARALRLWAHDRYQKQFQGLGLSPSYAVEDSEGLRAGITGYLENVSVESPHFEREGGCENWLSHRYGSHWQRGEWVAVDREVVIGYENEAEKEIEWRRSIKTRFDSFGVGLPALMQSRFKLPVQKKTVGNELDLLLWQPSTKELFMTEVKDGGDAAGVYLSPIQVGAYLAVWRRFVEAQPEKALDGVQSLLAQKIKLGLIPKEVLLPERINALRPAIIVQNPNRKSGCWKTMDGVLQLLQEAMPGCLDGLGLWAVENNALADITEKWREWA
jgi:hypothetical protein